MLNPLFALGLLLTLASPASSSDVWQGIEFTDIAGETWVAEDLRDRVVLLDFWATWCAPCLEEMPNLRRIHSEFREAGALVVGVAFEAGDEGDFRKWIRHHDVTWPQVQERRMERGRLARRFAVEAVPRTVLVDRRGQLVAIDLRGEALYVAIRDLVGAE